MSWSMIGMGTCILRNGDFETAVMDAHARLIHDAF